MDSHILREGPKHDAALAAYQKNHGGPLGSGFLEMVGFPSIDKYLQKDSDYVKANKSNDNLDPSSPHGQLHFELDFVYIFGNAFQWHYPTPKTGDHITVMVDLVRPVSDGGEVKLNSDDPLEQPNIILNYLKNDLDIIALREGTRYSYNVLNNSEGFKDIVED